MNVRLPRSFVSKLVLRFLFSESSTTDENERMTTTKTTQHAANERTNERTKERKKERTNERACRNDDDDDDELWCRASVSRAFGKMNTTWSYMIKQYESLKKTAADDEPKRDMNEDADGRPRSVPFPPETFVTRGRVRATHSRARTTHGLKRNAHQSAL